MKRMPAESVAAAGSNKGGLKLFVIKNEKV